MVSLSPNWPFGLRVGLGYWTRIRSRGTGIGTRALQLRVLESGGWGIGELGEDG